MSTLNFTFANETISNRAEFLRNLIQDGGRFQGVVIEANTTASLKPKKEGCPYGKKDNVRKDTTYHVDVNGKYADKINRIREKEGKEANFTARKSWHVKLYDTANGSIVAKRSEVENNLPITEVYLLCAVRFGQSKNYTIQGKPASEQEVAMIKKFALDRKEQASKSQGVDDGHIVTTIASSNLLEVRANKQVVRTF